MVMQARGNTEYGAIKMATARKYQIKKSEVALSTHRASLDGIKAIYDKATEYTYLIPEITGENMVSFAGGLLKTDKQELDVTTFNVIRNNFFICTQFEFEKGFTITSRLQVVYFNRFGVRWNGELNKVIPPNSTIESTGGITSTAWLRVETRTGSLEIDSGNGYSGFNLYKKNDDGKVRVELDPIRNNVLLNLIDRNALSEQLGKIEIPNGFGRMATQEWVQETDFLTWIPNDADLFEWISDKKSYFYKSGSGIKNTPVKTEPWYDYVWINHGVNTHGVLYAIGATGRVFVVTQVNAKWGSWKEAGFKGDSWIADKTSKEAQRFTSPELGVVNTSSLILDGSKPEPELRVGKSPSGKSYSFIFPDAGGRLVTSSQVYSQESSDSRYPLKDQALGLTKKYQDLRSQRELGQEYSNNTGYPIYISVVVSTINFTGYVDVNMIIDGKTMSSSKADITVPNNNTYLTVSGIVPPNSKYRVGLANNNVGKNEIAQWHELR